MIDSLKAQFLKLEYTVGFALPPRVYTSNVRSFYHRLTQLHYYCDEANSSCYSLPEDLISKIGLTLYPRVFISNSRSFCHRLTERHSSYNKTNYSCDSLPEDPISKIGDYDLSYITSKSVTSRFKSFYHFFYLSSLFL